MTVAQRHVAQQYAGRGGPSGLADVLEVLLDKGLVIDAYVRVSLVGIELLTVDARVVVASVDTYLRFAEAVNRLDLTQASNAQTLGDLVSGNGRDHRRSSTPESGNGRSDGADRSDRSARSAGDESAHRPEGTDADQHDAPRAGAEGQDEDTEPAQADTEPAAADDDPGLLSRIKQRGQAF